MIDEKCEAVLSLILTECGGSYKIFDSTDFEKIENFDRHVRYLSESGYVSLRYSREGEYLIAPTQKGSEYFKRKSQAILHDAVLCETLRAQSFKGAFFGSFIAFALVFVIIFVVAIFALKGCYAP